METIWKFELDIEVSQKIEMPKGAEILTIQMQGDNACLWALVDPEQPKEKRHIEMYGTGNPMLVDQYTERKYISTVQLYNGTLVFHFFERTK